MCNMFCPDNYDLLDIHESQVEKAYQDWMARLPECSECGKKIEDDKCYKIGGELFCEECIESFKVHTQNYMEE